jgi:hypothetical protein
LFDELERRLGAQKVVLVEERMVGCVASVLMCDVAVDFKNACYLEALEGSKTYCWRNIARPRVNAVTLMIYQIMPSGHMLLQGVDEGLPNCGIVI